jgi:hypothetical protein
MSDFNLLPYAHEVGLAVFAEIGAIWHAHIDDRPTNHLLSSQVQCVNALGRMVSDPSLHALAFGHVLDIAEVLPIEPGRFMTFEYIGPIDFFGETPRGPRLRGSMATAYDAAFKYRTSAGSTELALIEWKYTESYERPRRPEPAKDSIRTGRYLRFFEAMDGPLNSDVLDFEMLLDEPLYQLMRQQLLAHELEMARAEDADLARVLHVVSPQNVAYEQSLVRPEQRRIGATVSEVWDQLLRAKDRYVRLDPAIFIDTAITGPDYVDRYGEPR